MRDIILERLESIPGNDVMFVDRRALIGSGKCGYDSVWRRRHRFCLRLRGSSDEDDE